MFSGKTKKGFVYTLLIILFFFVVMGSIRTFAMERQIRESFDVSGVKASSMAGFGDSIQRSGREACLGSGYYGVKAAAEYSRNTKSYLSYEGVMELVNNGTISGSTTYTDGVDVHNVTWQMKGYCFSSWLSGLSTEASARNYAFSSLQERQLLSHDSSFSLELFDNLSASFSDESARISYDKAYNFRPSFGFEGFYDPVETIESFSMGNPTPGSKPVQEWPYGDAGELVELVGDNTLLVGGGPGPAGDNWVYAGVTKVSDVDEPDCSHSSVTGGDGSKILVVNNATTLLTNCCPTINSNFVGLVAEDNGTVDASSCLTIPYAIKSNPPGSNLTYDAILDSGSPPLLLNADEKQVVNMTLLLGALTGGYYRPTDQGPSFLKRLQGDLSADPNGIETFVIDGGTYRRPWTDWMYYSGVECDSIDPVDGVTCFKVKGMENCQGPAECAGNGVTQFRVDNETVFLGSGVGRLSYYGLEALPGLVVKET